MSDDERGPGSSTDVSHGGRRPPLDPSSEEMRRLGYRAVDLIVSHLSSLSDQTVARRGSAADFAALVDEPLPRHGFGADDCLDFFFRRVLPAVPKVNHPRFHAFIPVPGSFYGALGKILEAGTNAFAGTWLGAGAMASLELTALRWVAEAVGYDAQAAGLFTSGGSIANLCGLAAARARYGAQTLEDGVLYVSEQGHASGEKAAAILGYPTTSLRRIPVDARYRMQAEALARRIETDRRSGLRPFFVAANAGTVNTGSIDPLPAIADLCEEQDLWFHVDAAYGGFAATCRRGRRLLAGMERARSLTLDPHKWLYSPVGTGCILVRDPGALEDAFRSGGDYLKDVPRDEVNFFDRGPELSRPARGLAVWLLVRTVGLDALARQVEWDLRLAQLAEQLLAAVPGLEIVCPAELSVVSFRHRPRDGESEPERSHRDAELMERTLAAGEVMISSTELSGRSALRLVVQNHRTSESEVRRSVAAIARTVSV